MRENPVEMLPRVRQRNCHNDERCSDPQGQIELNSALHADPLVPEVGIPSSAHSQNNASGPNSVEKGEANPDHSKGNCELLLLG